MTTRSPKGKSSPKIPKSWLEEHKPAPGDTVVGLENKYDAASSAGLHSAGGHSQFESPEDGSIDPASPGVKGKVEMDHFDDTGGSSALVPFVPVRGRGRGRGAQKKESYVGDICHTCKERMALLKFSSCEAFVTPSLILLVYFKGFLVFSPFVHSIIVFGTLASPSWFSDIFVATNAVCSQTNNFQTHFLGASHGG